MSRKYEEHQTTFDGVTVQVDQEAYVPTLGSHFAGYREMVEDGSKVLPTVRRVHVMSTHAGGEIRSYVLDDANVLRLAGPAYTGRWTEMDDEVARAVGAASVHPYTLTPESGGSVS
jgi:hypothetical protein